MLNATLCATSRTLCCLLENFQTADGVRLPHDHALVPLLGGQSFFPFVRPALPVPEAPKAKAKSKAKQVQKAVQAPTPPT